MGKKISGSMKAQRTITDVIVHIFLVCVAIIWLIPFVWLVAHSFRGGVDRGQYAATFFPTEWTLITTPGCSPTPAPSIFPGCS